MANEVDWTDETPISLAEAVKRAFPEGTITPATLKRQVRKGILGATKPGKAYMTTLVDIKKMLDACRVVPAAQRRPVQSTSTYIPNSLGLTEIDLGRAELDAALANLRAMPRKR